MWCSALVIAAISVSPAWCSQPTNCSRTDGMGISGGVCKADYGSRFNIDSKELMGTTCVSRHRGMNKLLSSRLRQALDKMRQDFQTLQELIDQEASLNDADSLGSSWRGGALNVHRDYQKEPKSSVDKMARYYNDPPLGCKVPDMLSEEEQAVYNSQANFFGESCRYPQDNSSSRRSEESRLSKAGTRRDPLSQYDPRTAYEQQRILADIRVEPDVNEELGGVEAKEKNKYSEPEVPLPSIGLNPPNFAF